MTSSKVPFPTSGWRHKGRSFFAEMGAPVAFYFLTLLLLEWAMDLWAPLLSLVITVSGWVLYTLQRHFLKAGLDQGFQSDLSRDLCRILSGKPGLKNLPEEILVWITSNLHLAQAALYLPGPNQDYVRDPLPEGGEGGTGLSRMLNSDPFVGLLKYSRRPLFRSGISSGVLSREEQMGRERMLKLSAEVTVPLLAGDELIGFLNLGCRKDGSAPSREMIHGMSNLFSQIAVVLQNRLLCDKLRHSQARMRRADRLALLGTLAAGMAHEIRNPLVSIKTYFQLLPERYQDQEFRDRFQKVAANEVDRISKLIEELLKFSRPSDPTFRSVNLHDVIEEVLTLMASTADGSGVDLRRAFDEENNPGILCDPEQIKQVLINIAQNAFDAVEGHGVVWFRTRYDREGGDSGFVHLEVEDNGTGMAPEEIEKLFTPFYTTKPSGTGLGLAISRQIIEEHLGSLSVESEKGRGTIFCLHLPRNPLQHERRKEQSLYGQPERNMMVH